MKTSYYRIILPGERHLVVVKDGKVKSTSSRFSRLIGRTEDELLKAIDHCGADFEVEVLEDE